MIFDDKKENNLCLLLAKRNFVKHYPFKERLLSRVYNFSSGLHSKLLVGHTGCVNTLQFSRKCGTFLASGSDDSKIYFWKVHKEYSLNESKPACLSSSHFSNIFSLDFSHDDCYLFSGGNDCQVLIHDVNAFKVCATFLVDGAVNSVSANPFNNRVLLAASADGDIVSIDARQPSPNTIKSERSAFYSVCCNPCNEAIFSSAHSRNGVMLWDVRNLKRSLTHFGRYSKLSTSSCFNANGSKILCLFPGASFPVMLFSLNDPYEAQFEFGDQDFTSDCTIKTAVFVGSNEKYIACGSDDFNVYFWKIPETSKANKHIYFRKSSFSLKGHQSIVNQVKFSSALNILATSGVEKVIRLWSPRNFFLNTDVAKNGLPEARKKYSKKSFLEMIIRNGFLEPEINDETTDENNEMLAFFDYLVENNKASNKYKDSADASNSDSLSICSEDLSFSTFTSFSDPEDHMKGNTSEEEDSNSQSKKKKLNKSYIDYHSIQSTPPSQNESINFLSILPSEPIFLLSDDFKSFINNTSFTPIVPKPISISKNNSYIWEQMREEEEQNAEETSEDFLSNPTIDAEMPTCSNSLRVQFKKSKKWQSKRKYRK